MPAKRLSPYDQHWADWAARFGTSRQISEESPKTFSEDDDLATSRQISEESPKTFSEDDDLATSRQISEESPKTFSEDDDLATSVASPSPKKSPPKPTKK
jgi:hypothetical protein